MYLGPIIKMLKLKTLVLTVLGILIQNLPSQPINKMRCILSSLL